MIAFEDLTLEAVASFRDSLERALDPQALGLRGDVAIARSLPRFFWPDPGEAESRPEMVGHHVHLEGSLGGLAFASIGSDSSVAVCSGTLAVSVLEAAEWLEDRLDDQIHHCVLVEVPSRLVWLLGVGSPGVDGVAVLAAAAPASRLEFRRIYAWPEIAAILRETPAAAGVLASH